MESKEYGVQISEFCLDRTSLYSPAFKNECSMWRKGERQTRKDKTMNTENQKALERIANAEIWIPVKGFEGLYEVSDRGRVRSLNYNHTGETRQIATFLNKGTGYVYCCLSKDGQQRCVTVHRLVAEAFIPNPDGYEQIDHRNDKRTDNRVTNLRWVSRKQNNGKRHARKLRRLNYACNRHDGEMVMATNATTGKVLYFKNGNQCAKALNCSHVLIYNVLNPSHFAKTAKGWMLEHVPLYYGILPEKQQEG